MTGASPALPFEPELLWRWLAARSIARGLPLPVPDHGGMRVDTGSADEVRRYLFAGVAPGIFELAAQIELPKVYIKVCAAAGEVHGLPPRWRVRHSGYLMAQDGPPCDLPAPLPGHRIECEQDDAVTAVRILAGDGTVAASGYAAEHAGVFILDRILVDPAHRRRGLGRALVTALCSMQRAGASRRVLVATDEGCALYSTLGWHVLSPYTTAVIPAPSQ